MTPLHQSPTHTMYKEPVGQRGREERHQNKQACEKCIISGHNNNTFK